MVERRELMCLTILSYEFVSISIPPYEPLAIQRQSPIPLESMRFGLFIIHIL